MTRPPGATASMPNISNGTQNNVRKANRAIWAGFLISGRSTGVGESHIQPVESMKLNDDCGLGPFGFDMAKETGELYENVDECDGRDQRRR